MALSRMFGKIRYYFDTHTNNFTQAEARTQAIRQSGGRARITKDTDGWVVWSRSK